MATPERFEVETVVAGAGVIGLAVARELASRGQQVLLVERAQAIGTQTSSRSSQVIHAGLYYPTGSLKARLCVTGRHALYAYLESRSIAHHRCGKLVVACDDHEVSQLEALRQRAQDNGVTDLSVYDVSAVRKLEPELRVAAALYSPSSGIFDVHAFMVALQADFEAAGGQIVFDTSVVEGTVTADGGVEVLCRDAVGAPLPHVQQGLAGARETVLKTRRFVNCAGHAAPALARRIHGFPPANTPQTLYAKGSYFSLQGASPFKRLIYPLPSRDGLGIHVTLDLDGRARFGPDVQWVDGADDVLVDPQRRDLFVQAIRRYWQAIQVADLQPDYAGVRPKIYSPDDLAADFMIAGPQDHGLAGQVHLFGIESPGLTASLALASCVAKTLTDP
ncbi:MAG: NAD(P)/FAD-dependent oxidoreductase [Pseudomonadota bacterium]